jgi:hypothetical protein
VIVLTIGAFLLSCNFYNLITKEPSSTQQEVVTTIQTTPVLPTSTFTVTPTPEPIGYFKVVILVDLSSAPVGEEDADEVLAESSAMLYRLTGFAFQMVDFATEFPHEGEKPSELPDRYLDEHPDIRPNGIIFFTYGDERELEFGDGHTGASKSLPSFRNEFGGFDYIPIAVVNRYAKYAACGYNEVGELVSDVSIDGQCRNRPGIPCTEKNGYSMCSEDVDRLYASTENYFVASTIVHEFMHPYGFMDVYKDHITTFCEERMGWQPLDWWDEAVLRDSQMNNGICPDIYLMFVDSYRP